DGPRAAAEGDRRNRRCGIGPNPGKTAQFGLLARKLPAPPGDLLGAGVQVPRPGIIAEAGESADHSLCRSGCEILHPRPFRQKRLIIGRRRLSRRLLQQDLGQPNPVGNRRFPRRRPPGKVPAALIPPWERPCDDRVSLCRSAEHAYIDIHAAKPLCPGPTMKSPRRGAKPLAAFMPEIIEEALAARGLSEASLVADW